MKRIGTFLMAMCMVAISMFPMSVLAEDVKPSNEEYELSFKGFDTFFGNATPVKPGTEVYLTYTVEEIREDNASTQNGVMATDGPEEDYPYLNGGVLDSSNTAPLLEEGARYFFRFKYTKEKGFEYVVAKAKGEESKYIVFDSSTSQSKDYPFTDVSTHFGVWFGGIVSVRLNHVRCYDKEGNDLGVLAPKHQESLMDTVKSMGKVEGLNHNYYIKVTDGMNVAISNATPTDAKTMYMEYTVKSCDTKIYQYGLINTRKPEIEYPFKTDGMLLVESMYEGGQLVKNAGYLLQEGASYIIRFERKSQYFMALIQKTYNGKTELKEITNKYGEYVSGAQFFSLWFGEGRDCPVNFELTDFKCYDAEKNNLGVQANHTASQNKPVVIEHYGEIEDYSGCEAMYYCKEEGAVVALYADKTGKVTRDGKTEEITYLVEDDILTLYFANKTETYEYWYQKFTDEEGRTYVRLSKYYVTFVDGASGTETKEQVGPKEGYRVKRPADPVREGADFLGWCLADGTEFSFEDIIDKSVTVYAKWSDFEDFIPVGNEGMQISSQVIAIGVSTLILIAGVVGGILMARKVKKNG